MFHYHYQWDKSGEVARAEVALQEHEAVLHALVDRDFAAAERRLDHHLATAVRTLLASATSPARLAVDSTQVRLRTVVRKVA